MKFFLTLALALVLLAVESVVVKYLGLSVTRIDVTVTIVAFLALRAGTVEGAFSSLAVGYLLDVMSGRPTGLFLFLAVFLFLLCRLAVSLVDVRSGFSFALFAMGADAAHGLLAAFFSWMVSNSGGGVAASLGGLPLQVVLTGAAGLLLYPVFKRIDPGTDRPQVGALL
jgi:rod shape-determining protein MreD